MLGRHAAENVFTSRAAAVSNSAFRWICYIDSCVFWTFCLYSLHQHGFSLDLLLLRFLKVVSHIKNFLPGDRVGVARMSETLWDVENLLRLGWTSSAASRPR